MRSAMGLRGLGFRDNPMFGKSVTIKRSDEIINSGSDRGACRSPTVASS